MHADASRPARHHLKSFQEDVQPLRKDVEPANKEESDLLSSTCLHHSAPWRELGHEHTRALRDTIARGAWDSRCQMFCLSGTEGVEHPDMISEEYAFGR